MGKDSTDAARGTSIYETLKEYELTIPDVENNPGKVVKCFREHMVYEDQTTGKQKHWTQADLAVLMGLTKVQVCNMENHNDGLDSIEKRKTLATILKIPPILLGLGSLDSIVEIVTGREPQKTTPVKRTKLTKQDIQKYHDTFRVYDVLFAEGMTYTSVTAIENMTRRIQADLENVSTEDKNELLRVLWDFEVLCDKVYTSDFMNWQKAYKHIENAIEIATALNDTDLLAISLRNRSIDHMRQGKMGLAKVDIDGALLYSKGALPQTKGILYTLNAWYQVKSGNITLAQTILDSAEKYAGVKSDVTPIKFGIGRYLLDRGESLIAQKKPARALEFLDSAEQQIHFSKKRLLVYLDILRAKCYTDMKKPEYEHAVTILESAIADSKKIRVERNIRFIERLYKKLGESSYGNTPQVANLGMQLRGLRARV